MATVRCLPKSCVLATRLQLRRAQGETELKKYELRGLWMLPFLDPQVIQMQDAGCCEAGGRMGGEVSGWGTGEMQGFTQRVNSGSVMRRNERGVMMTCVA